MMEKCASIRSKWSELRGTGADEALLVNKAESSAPVAL